MKKNIAFMSGRFRLQGILHLPKILQPPVVIGSHGLYADKNSPKQIELARRCNARNIAYFRFDHCGCGESEGNPPERVSIDARCRDLTAALNLMTVLPDIGGPLGLFGSSMGGATSLAVASKFPIAAMVTVAAPLRSQNITPVPDAPSPVKTTPSSHSRVDFDISDRLDGIHSILIFHGDADTVVPAKNAYEIHEKATSPKRLIIQSAGDHRMTLPRHQEEFMDETMDWFIRFLMSSS